MSLLFVHQIAKYISKDNCGLHEPVAGSQAKTNNRDGKKKELPYIIHCAEDRQESDVQFMCHKGVFKGLEFQLSLLQVLLEEHRFPPYLAICAVILCMHLTLGITFRQKSYFLCVRIAACCTIAHATGYILIL